MWNGIWRLGTNKVVHLIGGSYPVAALWLRGFCGGRVRGHLGWVFLPLVVRPRHALSSSAFVGNGICTGRVAARVHLPADDLGESVASARRSRGGLCRLV